jgi:hypothetical protein
MVGTGQEVGEEIDHDQATFLGLRRKKERTEEKKGEV